MVQRFSNILIASKYLNQFYHNPKKLALVSVITSSFEPNPISAEIIQVRKPGVIIGGSRLLNMFVRKSNLVYLVYGKAISNVIHGDHSRVHLFFVLMQKYFFLKYDFFLQIHINPFIRNNILTSYL